MPQPREEVSRRVREALVVSHKESFFAFSSIAALKLILEMIKGTESEKKGIVEDIINGWRKVRLEEVESQRDSPLGKILMAGSFDDDFNASLDAVCSDLRKVLLPDDPDKKPEEGGSPQVAP